MERLPISQRVAETQPRPRDAAKGRGRIQSPIPEGQGLSRGYRKGSPTVGVLCLSCAGAGQKVAAAHRSGLRAGSLPGRRPHDDVRRAVQWVLGNESWMAAALAVLVVGSAVRAKRTVDSDIDVALIVAGEPAQPVETVVDGHDLGIAFYAAGDFESWPEVALVE